MGLVSSASDDLLYAGVGGVPAGASIVWVQVVAGRGCGGAAGWAGGGVLPPPFGLWGGLLAAVAGGPLRWGGALAWVAVGILLVVLFAGIYWVIWSSALWLRLVS